MKIEDKYILELCKFIYPNKIAIESMMKKPLNYQYILGQLLYNRMGGVAYYTLLKSNLLKDTNREFRNTLKIIFESGVSKTDALHTSLGYLYTILKDVDFNYAILKGSFLVNLYPDGLRTSNDIDILISPENITDLSKMLISSGFKQGFIHNNSFVQANRKEIINSRMNRGETIPFIKELNMPNIKYLELDVNFSLDFKSGNDKEIVRSLLNDANELKRSRLKTLNEIDFLIHLCTHLFKEATVMAWVNMGRDLSLYKFCDISLFLHAYGTSVFYEKLTKRITDLNLCSECYFSLYYTCHLFDIVDSNLFDLLKNIKPDDEQLLNRVIEPSLNKIFTYTIDLKKRIFCSNRKEYLYEVGDV